MNVVKCVVNVFDSRESEHKNSNIDLGGKEVKKVQNGRHLDIYIY